MINVTVDHCPACGTPFEVRSQGKMLVSAPIDCSACGHRLLKIGPDPRQSTPVPNVPAHDTPSQRRKRPL